MYYKSGCELNSFSKFQIGVTLSKNDDFAKEAWFSSILGKNVLSKMEGEHFRCALIHKRGAYIVDIPRHLLNFSSTVNKWLMQPPQEIKDALPEIDETCHIRVFQIAPISHLLDAVFIQHPHIKNMYFTENNTENLIYLFIEGEAYGIGVDKRMIVK